MIEVNTTHQLRRHINEHGGILDCPIISLSKFFNADDQLNGMWFYLERLWSIKNYYKVESHTIVTKSLFLMNFYGVIVDFAENKIFVECDDGTELYIKFNRDREFLGRVLYSLLDLTNDSEDKSYNYDVYRNETRCITDHLKESDQPRVILNKLIKLTEKYIYTP